MGEVVRTEFQMLMSRVIKGEYKQTARELEDDLEVMAGSVKRWASGVAKPMPRFEALITTRVKKGLKSI